MAQEDWQRMELKKNRKEEEERENEVNEIIVKKVIKGVEINAKEETKKDQEEVLDRRLEAAEAQVLRTMEAYETKCDMELETN